MRVKFDSLIKVFNRTVRFSFFKVSSPPVEIGNGIQWVDFDGLIKVGNCQLELLFQIAHGTSAGAWLPCENPPIRNGVDATSATETLPASGILLRTNE